MLILSDSNDLGWIRDNLLLNEIINEFNIFKENYELRIFIRQQKELNY